MHDLESSLYAIDKVMSYGSMVALVSVFVLKRSPQPTRRESCTKYSQKPPFFNQEIFALTNQVHIAESHQSEMTLTSLTPTGVHELFPARQT